MLNFWIVYAFACALLALPIIVLICVFGETVKGKILGTFLVLLFTLAFVGAMYGEAESNAEKWNGGYCECGTHWELVAASKYRSTETKYYACPNCHTEIEIKN